MNGSLRMRTEGLRRAAASGMKPLTAVRPKSQCFPETHSKRERVGGERLTSGGMLISKASSCVNFLVPRIPIHSPHLSPLPPNKWRRNLKIRRMRSNKNAISRLKSAHKIGKSPSPSSQDSICRTRGTSAPAFRVVAALESLENAPAQTPSETVTSTPH